MSPFKTNQKTLKKGDEKKTEPTAVDPSTTSLPKNNDKVKGQSALLMGQITRFTKTGNIQSLSHMISFSTNVTQDAVKISLMY